MKIVNQGASFVLVASIAGFNLTPMALPVAAQIIPDSTLPNPSIVLPGGQVSIVGGGSAVGTNLFHSFQEFSLAPGTGAIFNYPPAIQNVFGRVTGTGISRIEGFIGASGTANLFLLNPNGFIFGPQAAVNIGGSFLAATADSLHFPGGVEFSAANPQASLLSTTVPIGLSFSPNAGSISVRGRGYSISEIPPTSPFFIDPPSSGLSASEGGTLALLGGTVELEGGTAISLGGHVELGAVRQGWVGLQPAARGWQFDYSRVNAFGNIQVRDLALVGALGPAGGSVRLSGQDITVEGGGLVLIQNFGDAPAGDLQVEARGTLRIAGDVVNPNPGSPFAVGRSSLTTEALGSGAGGDIAIRAHNLLLQEGGVIGARTFGAGDGGAIKPLNSLSKSEQDEVLCQVAKRILQLIKGEDTNRIDIRHTLGRVRNSEITGQEVLEKDTKLDSIQEVRSQFANHEVWSDKEGLREAKEGLREALIMARRILAILERQAAGFTALSMPPELQINLEEKRREVAELEDKLQNQAKKTAKIKRNIIKGYNLDTLIYQLCQHINYEGAFAFTIGGHREILDNYVIERIFEALPTKTRRTWKRHDIHIYESDLNLWREKIIEERLKAEINCQNFSGLFDIKELGKTDILLIIWNYEIPLKNMSDISICCWEDMEQKSQQFLIGKSRCLIVIWANAPAGESPLNNFILLPVPDKFEDLENLAAWFGGELEQVELSDGHKLNKTEIEEYKKKIKSHHGHLVGTYTQIQRIIEELQNR